MSRKREPWINKHCPVCFDDYEGPRRRRDGCWCDEGCDSPDCVAAMADAAYERHTPPRVPESEER